MPVDFNPMLSNYRNQIELASSFGLKVGLAGWPWVFEEVGHHAETLMNKGN